MVDAGGAEGYDGGPGAPTDNQSAWSVSTPSAREQPLPSVADLLAKHFIARPDAKAIQVASGAYNLHTTDGNRESPRLPWRRADIESHLAGQQTFGHYLLSTEDKVKFFAFDLDLDKNGDPEKVANPHVGSYVANFGEDAEPIVYSCDAREAWLDRAHPARPWLKYQLRLTAGRIMSAIWEQLELPCAMAYTGAKGLHVYAFTGLISAADAREGSQIVLDYLSDWQPSRGSNFYRNVNQDWVTGIPNITIETFPKQDSLGGKDLGNLMRLPLGRNRKNPKDPTFFIDPRDTRMSTWTQLDPTVALSMRNPWADS